MCSKVLHRLQKVAEGYGLLEGYEGLHSYIIGLQKVGEG